MELELQVGIGAGVGVAIGVAVGVATRSWTRSWDCRCTIVVGRVIPVRAMIIILICHRIEPCCCCPSIYPSNQPTISQSVSQSVCQFTARRGLLINLNWLVPPAPPCSPPPAGDSATACTRGRVWRVVSCPHGSCSCRLQLQVAAAAAAITKQLRLRKTKSSLSQKQPA